MSANGDQMSSLNELFKCLEEVDEETQEWKEILDCLTVMLRSAQFGEGDNFRIYGSSVEGLKNVYNDNLGDLDMMIIPSSDYSPIDEQMLEYLPENPAFVKMKGIGHPFFQWKLFDIKHVTSSALKEDAYRHFLPFNDETDWMELNSQMTAIFESFFHKPLPTDSLINVYNNREGAAFTCEMAVPVNALPFWKIVLDNLRILDFKKLDPGELEFIPLVLCLLRAVDYSPQHAELFDNFLQHAKVSLQSLQPLFTSLNTLILGIPSFIEEVWYNEKAKELRTRLNEIESGTNKESRSKQEDFSDLPADAIMLVPDTDDPNALQLHFSKEFCERLGKQTAEAMVEASGVFKDQENSAAGCEDQELDTQGKPSPAYLLPRIEETCQDENRFLVALLSIIQEEEPNPQKTSEVFQWLGTKSLEYTKVPLSHPKKFSIDMVPAIEVRGWPKVAREWINRKRQWPSPETIHSITEEGFHVVSKTTPNSGCSETDFRLSFSHAEYLLSQELNDIQQQCYRCIKKIYNACLSTEPKCLVTYHLKTIFLRTCEETGSRSWTEETRADCVMKLLARLHDALTNKYLQHYFIATYNLFDANSIATPEILDSLAVKVEQIMANPTEFVKELIVKKENQSMDAASSTNGNQEEVTKTSKAKENSVDDNFQRNDSKMHEQDKTGTEKSQTSSQPHEQVTVRRHHTIDNYSMSEAHETRKTPRFHELKDVFLETCIELVSTAADDCSIEPIDPVARSLVQDFKELIKAGIDPDSLLATFERQWNMTYLRMFFNSEFYTKHSMLMAMQNDVKVIKRCLSGEDVRGCQRDCTLSHLNDDFANVGKRLKRILNSMKSDSTKQPTLVTDDIPLD